MTEREHQHESVLLEEGVAALITDPDGIYVDATFGRGGHSRKILEMLGAEGRLIVIDKDPQAIEVANDLANEDKRVTVCHGSFSLVGEFFAGLGIARPAGVFADLGVSSPQLDDPSRGFSFQNDGPLDMRMDTSAGQTAADWLREVSKDDLADVLKLYGEERFAKKIASAIVDAGKNAPIVSTLQLAKIVTEANPAWEKHKHPATRSFQAIRIYINKELDDLETFLEQSSSLLSVGGRLSVISFHSLEDRIVKRFMNAKVKGVQPPPGVPVMEKDIQRHFKLHSKAVKPTSAEVATNIRSRSAILRSLEKVSYD